MIPPGPPRPAMWLLVVMTGLGPFSMQILIPALPRMAVDLGVPYGIAQLTLTLYLIGVALGQLLYGPLADRFGRRPVMLGALALYLVASALSAFAPSMAWLGIGRVAQAMGACSGMVLGRAIIRDVWPRDQAASRIGYVVMAMTLAPMLAPMVGALIEERFGWRSSMVACLLFGAPLLLAVWLRLPETLREPQPLPGLRGMGLAHMSLLRLPAFRWIAAVGAASTGVFFAFMAGAPRVAEAMGHTPRDYATAFLAISVCFAGGSWMAGRFSARMGLARMLSAGLWIIILGSGVMLAVQLFLPHSLMGFFLPMALVALGNGISLPNAVAAAISVRPERAGTASGLLGAMQMGFGALMTLVNGAFETGAGVASALVMAGCGIASSVALRGARRHL
ncbi:MFS transporter, DHA1 family, bicyclomycin/chloramphenicol resistance protein [Roseomonas rosea]|uniref:Bcr/CflA family efflux transporter n=1 Tax=Muricoccus roseus TaxID=198092 RepID=A0A1M6MLT0_9PROT|nr:multidrug effflux MFS transporter [Roseomonas rosea]SHJ84427.1 MFS transporter, DHA1 family, bicyclomycin/chloramphenicol resistance protein [Roseomonas rosea]